MILLNLLATVHPSQETIIVRDFNIDLLKNYNQSNAYLESLFMSGFIQTITKPIRCNNHCATLLDHSLTNMTQQIFDTAILTT
jgi:hypothetical protein